MKRDFPYWEDDNFEIALDTYFSKRNAFIFVINPNGARSDVLVTDDGKGFNQDWNGVWDVACTINDNIWCAEIEIPYSTLKFPDVDIQKWGINFERNIRSKRESQFWQGWSRDYDFEYVSHAGYLDGLLNISGKETIELKPYITLGAATNDEQKTIFKKNIGGDANYLITPTLKLNLTANTDFAQVESDREQINMNRFSIWFPEKRDFFLEGKDDLDFSLYDGAKIFYSRQLGIKNGGIIPIIGGAKILGQSGDTKIGAISLATSAKDSEPLTVYNVLRIKQNVFEKSYIGMAVTSKNQEGHYNYVYGIDGMYLTSSLFKDKNFQIMGMLNQSQTQNIENKNNLSYRAIIAYPNDVVSTQAGIARIDENFNPELGFLERSNYRLYYYDFYYKPYVDSISLIRRFLFMPIKLQIFTDNFTNDMESRYITIKPFAVEFKNGDVFQFNIDNNYENVTALFDFLNGDTIPVGIYRSWRYSFDYSSFEGYNVSYNIGGSTGEFFNGTRNSINGSTKINMNKHINVSGDITINHFIFPGNTFDTYDIGGRIEYSFTPKLNTFLFGQWNNLNKQIIINIRLHWIPVVGSDLYFVVNQEINTNNGLKTGNFTVLSKFIWRIGV